MQNFIKFLTVPFLGAVLFFSVSTCNAEKISPFDSSATVFPSIDALTVDSQLEGFENSSEPKVIQSDIDSINVANLSTNSHELHILSKSTGWKVRQAVAKNPNISAEDLCKLSVDPNEEVQNAVLVNPIITDDTSARVFFSCPVNKKVRLAIAKNGNSPASTLFILAEDSDPEVVAAVLTHPKLISSLANQRDLDVLSKSNNWKIRLAVAENRNTTFDTIGILMDDDERQVKEAARSTQEYHIRKTDLDRK